MAKGEFAKAVECLLRVIDQDKELVSETLEMLQTCYQQLDKPNEWVAFLRRCVEENTGAMAELMLADVVEQHEGNDTAQVYITRQLQRHPTMRVFHKLMDYHLNDAEEGRAKESLMVLRDMVGSKCAVSRATAARSVDLPRIRFTGIVLHVARGQPLSQSAVWMGSDFLKLLILVTTYY